MGLAEKRLFAYIASVNDNVRREWKTTKLRFGKRYIGISWLNDFAYCEYKFENEFGGGGVTVEDFIDSLPQDVQDDERKNLARSDLVKSRGTSIHTDISDYLTDCGEKNEIEVAAPYVGVCLDGVVRGAPLFGRIDFPPYTEGSPLHIVDWKTGSPPKNRYPFNGDVLQVLGYCYVLRYILDSSPEFEGIPIVGHIYYTGDGQHHQVDYGSDDSVVYSGFTQFRKWADYTPSGLISEKLGMVWEYWSGCREAIPTGTRKDGDGGRCRSCEYRSFCSYSSFCRR